MVQIKSLICFIIKAAQHGYRSPVQASLQQVTGPSALSWQHAVQSFYAGCAATKGCPGVLRFQYRCTARSAVFLCWLRGSKMCFVFSTAAQHAVQSFCAGFAAAKRQTWCALSERITLNPIFYILYPIFYPFIIRSFPRNSSAADFSE